ncbi:MAG TPA: SDR family NAD(P)-dependent oxidoreductase [Oligoflexus sp.]|uniref:SDR family NAD(P)-dependent oxidoreductase n=1 Tax=Oligoflexus sp. TaxID=1971216 RepID=UPI002D5852EA|nr:SDR family NAD(P)-dependent oxidoreductase [Oligoflexus sp.]HYX32360.1 SDR family NAD(P)-dependent oxidoreductase [Oligoflexus sp.]
MSSITFEQSLEIQRPLSFVYAYLSDFSNTASWDPSVIQAQKTTPGPLQVGTHFDIQVKFAWTQLSLNYHITEMHKDRYLELKGMADNYSLVDRIRFEGDDTRCTIHYQIDVYYQDPMSKLAPILSPLVKANAGHALKTLKRTLEGAATDWQPTAWTKLADHMVLPGLFKFTRRGFIAGKSRWTGIATDLSSKNILITGATSGIGAAAARSLGRLGANLIVVARNEKKAQHFSELLVSEGCKAPRIEIADLSLMQDVQNLITRLLKRGEPIHVLINNAGALFNQRVVTAEGVEQSFATLLLAPYMLTEGLRPLLEKAGQARVINVTSGGMYTQPVVLNDLEFEHEDYNGSKAYARAKRGLVDITELWAQEWKAAGITVHSMHPGWADTPAVSHSLPKFYEKTKPWLRTPEQGADTIVWLAATPEAVETTGLFWLDRTPHSTAIFPKTRSRPETQAELRTKLNTYVQRFRTGEAGQERA